MSKADILDHPASLDIGLAGTAAKAVDASCGDWSHASSIAPASAPALPGLPGACIGALIGFRDQGRTPLVIFRGQAGHAAVAARSTQDLHAAHIGRQVVLLFEDADPRRPIIVGCLQRADTWSFADQVGSVEVEADGARVIVSAKEQLVLQCGKASITLTKAGKVLIRGEYVSSRSSGVHLIKGGAVQIN